MSKGKLYEKLLEFRELAINGSLTISQFASVIEALFDDAVQDIFERIENLENKTSPYQWEAHHDWFMHWFVSKEVKQ